MNILILNEEGPEAVGLQILRETVKENWRGARVLTLSPKKGAAGQGASTKLWKRGWREGLTRTDLELVENEHFTADLTPCDLALLAFTRRELFLSLGKEGAWDRVYCGVGHAAALGLDVLASGGAAVAMTIQLAYGVPTVAFHQEAPTGTDLIATNDRKPFRTAERALTTTMHSLPMLPGTAWIVNFPTGAANGSHIVHGAHYHVRYPPETSLVPRAREEESDATALAKSMVTCVPLTTRLNPPLRF